MIPRYVGRANDGNVRHGKEGASTPGAWDAPLFRKRPDYGRARGVRDVKGAEATSGSGGVCVGVRVRARVRACGPNAARLLARTVWSERPERAACGGCGTPPREGGSCGGGRRVTGMRGGRAGTSCDGAERELCLWCAWGDCRDEEEAVCTTGPSANRRSCGAWLRWRESAGVRVECEYRVWGADPSSSVAARVVSQEDGVQGTLRSGLRRVRVLVSESDTVRASPRSPRRGELCTFGRVGVVRAGGRGAGEHEKNVRGERKREPKRAAVSV